MTLGILALVTLIVIIAILAALLYQKSFNDEPDFHEAPEKLAGLRGERVATNAIKKVLREDDCLLTNVSVSFDEKDTELDNIVINKYGVFIIEVKSYKGRLHGMEDDYEWKKYKDDGYGNTFVKDVKNPIRQVKRQIYILAKHLQYYGIDVWVEGYVLFVKGNSPVDSPRVLTSLQDIDRAIHTFGRNRLDKKTVNAVRQALE